jgi:hypothetical protein
MNLKCFRLVFFGYDINVISVEDFLALTNDEGADIGISILELAVRISSTNWTVNFQFTEKFK